MGMIGKWGRRGIRDGGMIALFLVGNVKRLQCQGTFIKDQSGNRGESI